MIVEQGHEVGMHGYSHENPISMSPEQEEAVLLRCIDLITEVSGKRPRGYVAPWWEFSHVTNELLLKHGIKYDHSLMHRDFECYYVRVGDRWTKIDYGMPADYWMHALERGEETGPGGDTGQLVPGRPAADDVHQGVAQQPRVRESPGH